MTQTEPHEHHSSFPRPFYRWRPHPWHGLEVGPEPPVRLNTFVEVTPFDTVKYEVDKETGYLRCDRPQPSSSLPPTLYGFVPRTYCGDRVGALCPDVGCGDGDPLDICVLSERPITRSEVILSTRVVGAIRMVDRGEVDDKIIAVLESDGYWADARDIVDLPPMFVQRLQHYFSFYKRMPGEAAATVDVREPLTRAQAIEVVEAAMADYEDMFGS